MNPKYVGLEYSDPSKPLVMIVKDTEMTPVVSAFVKGLVPQENGEPKKIYKVFSTAELSEEMLNVCISLEIKFTIVSNYSQNVKRHKDIGGTHIPS